MPNPELTHIAFILDRSGSMEPMRQAAVDGFNAFLSHQKEQPGVGTISLVQFSDRVTTTWEGLPLPEVELGWGDYTPAGGTALYDAVGSTVDSLGRKLAALPEPQRPGKVLIAILTDGEENASRRYGARDVLERVRHQTEVYGWEFLFLGASASWMEQARTLGIATEDAANFAPSAEGLQEAMLCASESVARRRRRH